MKCASDWLITGLFHMMAWRTLNSLDHNSNTKSFDMCFFLIQTCVLPRNIYILYNDSVLYILCSWGGPRASNRSVETCEAA